MSSETVLGDAAGLDAERTARAVRHMTWIAAPGKNMRNHRIKVALAPGAAVIVATILIMAFVSNGTILDFFVLAFIFAIAAIGVDIVVGLTGQLSLGHNGLFAVGAYGSGILARDVTGNPWAGLLVAIALTCLVAVIVGAVALRLAHFYFALLTLAFGLFVEQFLVAWRSVTGGPSGLSGVDGLGGGTFVAPNYEFWIMASGAGLAVALIAGCALRDSQVGAAWRAIGADERLAETSGIRVYRQKVLAFTISGAFLGLAGFLYTRYVQFIDPGSFSPELMIALLVMVFIGSSGTVTGALLGAILVRAFNLLPGAVGHYRLILYGVVLIAVLTTLRASGLHSVLTLGANGLRRFTRRSAGPV